MGNISGKGGKVMKGSVVLAEITDWSMSGFSMGTIKKDPAFGDTITEYVADGVGDPGTISFSGNYDPADTNGQKAIQALVAAGTGLTDLYLYVNTSTFWRVASGGEIIVTKANAVTLPRNGMGKISFEGQVSGAKMEQVGTGT
jgi:subtilase family serine protease